MILKVYKADGSPDFRKWAVECNRCRARRDLSGSETWLIPIDEAMRPNRRPGSRGSSSSWRAAARGKRPDMLLTTLIQRHRARDLYWDIGVDASRVTAQLHATREPSARCELLNRLADHKQELAELHPAAFGTDPNPDAATASLWSAAALIRQVADTEWYLTDTTPGDTTSDAYLDVSEAVLWRKLATARNPADRAELLDQLADYAETRVGEEAAEVLVAIARTELELANARAEGRPPVAPKTSNRSRVVIAAAIVTAAVAVELPDLLSLIH